MDLTRKKRRRNGSRLSLSIRMPGDYSRLWAQFPRVNFNFNFRLPSCKRKNGTSTQNVSLLLGRPGRAKKPRQQANQIRLSPGLNILCGCLKPLATVSLELIKVAPPARVVSHAAQWLMTTSTRPLIVTGARHLQSAFCTTLAAAAAC